jgi:carboxypeptidase family protein
MSRPHVVLALAVVIVAAAHPGAQRGADPARGASPTPTGIAGRVVDASGAPVKSVYVTALYPNAERVYGFDMVNVQLRAETGDDGRYVLDSLRPGEYYVIAVPRNAPLDSASRLNRAGHANTFHPNALRAADATRVRVVAGIATADITLAPAKLSAITGVVIGSSGQPAGGVRVALARGDGLFGLFPGGFVVQPDGRFGISGLQPGTYYLHYREGQWPPPVDAIPKVSGATVIVQDADVTDVRVQPIPMVRGSGRLVVDPAARSGLNLAAITVAGIPVDFNGNPGPTRGGTVRDDLTFEFLAWPAVGRLRVGGLPPAWTVGTIRINGVDMTSKTIEFVGGKDLTGIEVELIKR